uniref:Plasmid mobilization protein n=1 Tax=Ascaris lumbricoides TaxID=6252 RepID=A0A0M3HHX5_ASCLU
MKKRAYRWQFVKTPVLSTGNCMERDRERRLRSE